MNERIRELAVQAGVDAGQTIANIICGDDEFKALGNEFNKLNQATRECIYKLIEQNQEKFAELIVKECVNREELLGAIARGWCSEKNSHKTMDPDLALAIFDEVERQIKQQFGVE